MDSKLAKKSSFDYVALDVDDKLEKQIQKIKLVFIKKTLKILINSINRVISELTAEQINYMVLRDVNYFVEIFAGQCVSIGLKKHLSPKKHIINFSPS